MTHSTSAPVRFRGRTARAVFACAALACAAALSACSAGNTGNGTNGKAPQVASLPSSISAVDSAGSGTATTAPAVDQSSRPQLRLDSSPEEIKAAWQTYYVCLKEHGHKMLLGRDPAGNSPDQSDNSAAAKAAQKACLGKLPLQPPEMSQSTNPHYLDQYHNYMTCLNSHGLAVHAIDPFGTGWTYNDGVTQKLNAAQMQNVDRDCKTAAFSGH